MDLYNLGLECEQNIDGLNLTCSVPPGKPLGHSGGFQGIYPLLFSSFRPALVAS